MRRYEGYKIPTEPARSSPHIELTSLQNRLRPTDEAIPQSSRSPKPQRTSSPRMHFAPLALALPILRSTLALALVAPVAPRSVDLRSAHLAQR
jgi:hypothetical protein